METKRKKSVGKSVKQNDTAEVTESAEITEQKPKSYTRLFWEKYPDGIIKIIDMKAVLR